MPETETMKVTLTVGLLDDTKRCVCGHLFYEHMPIQQWTGGGADCLLCDCTQFKQAQQAVYDGSYD